MNAANIDRSARLQRVLAVLGDYRPHTTRELIDAAHRVPGARSVHLPAAAEGAGAGGAVRMTRLLELQQALADVDYETFSPQIPYYESASGVA